MKKIILSLALLLAPVPAFAQWQTPNHSVPVGRGAPNTGFKSVTMTNGQLLVGQTGADPQSLTVSGDCTFSALGALICTKTNGVSFAASATTDTTNAANIGSGTLNCGREPALTGDVTSSAGSCGTSYANALPVGKLPADSTVWRTATTTDTLLTSDCWKTVQEGTGTSGYFTVTLPVVSGFPTGCRIKIKNGDTGRAKLLSGFPSDIANVRLWPLQSIEVTIINGAWVTSQQPGRWLLPANQTIFVDSSASGKDDTTVDGLASGSAFHTSVFAYNTMQQNADLGGFVITENQVTNTITYTTTQNYIGPLTGCKQASPSSSSGACYIINGNGIATTTFSTSTASQYLFQIQAGAAIQVQNAILSSSASGGGIMICISGYGAFKTVNFAGTGANSALDVNGPQCALQATGSYTISGSYNIFAVAEDMGIIYLSSQQATISGTPAWTTAFVQADLKGFIEASGFTFTGAGATGKRCQAISQGTIFTAGGSLATFFPGNVNGTADAASFAYFN